jgi:hypothetical protein
MVKKSIIALQGDPDTGKSITIGVLFELMKQNGFQIIQDKKRKNSKDFFVIVKNSGVLIGISSYGDTEYWIKERCGRFVKEGCKIIICACHKKGKTVNAVLSFGEYVPTFIPKTVATTSQQGKANSTDAGRLLRIIDSLIK